MCVGEVTDNIFSTQFINCRCEAHQVSLEQYNKLTLRPLQMLFKNQFSHIVLWFDDDMFCQINLLTILAYLNQINYSYNVTFNLVGPKFSLVNSFEFSVQGYYQLFKEVMLNRCIPENINLSILENGIRLYLQYLKEENEITIYIKQHEGLRVELLVTELLKLFPEYGLGDTQYIQLIEKCKKSN